MPKKSRTRKPQTIPSERPVTGSEGASQAAMLKASGCPFPTICQIAPHLAGPACELFQIP